MTEILTAQELMTLGRRTPFPGSAPIRATTAPSPEPKPLSTWGDIAKILGPIDWHWSQWLAPGFFHLLAGPTGAGKSALALRVAACYLAGWPWPDGSPFGGQIGKVLWLETESAQAINVQRATDWGLPLQNILYPLSNPLDDLDWRRHQGAIREAAMLADVRLVVLDSLSGANGGRVDENSQGMIVLGQWLAKLGQETRKPVLGNHHTRKRGLADGDTPGLDRVRGSGTIPQLARVVWMLDTPKASEPNALRLSVVKSNLAKMPEPIGMTFDAQGQPLFGHAPEEPDSRGETDEAIDWLREVLQEGAMSSSDIYLAAEAGGISRRTLERAKAALKVRSEKAGNVWQWRLP